MVYDFAQRYKGLSHFAKGDFEAGFANLAKDLRVIANHSVTS
ncbi:hypothetical protein OESDEN_02677 [Oesophagostomum dentatum]|uniref:Uncharacterized protein n=1 Tax=Oesophagostomum dentatum TaxID=61180 RepID=A0A0B1TND5_OESDE|nr:hypothetical protein OESDEN_02677 [Oesophagostomum dentatum]